MIESEIRAALYDAIMANANVSIDDLRDDCCLRDLADSLELIQIAIDLESFLGIDLERQELFRIGTIGQIVAHLRDSYCPAS